MKEVIFNAGTKVSLTDELNSVQQYMYDNTYAFIELFIENTGVMCDTISGIISPSDTSLKLSYSTGAGNGGTAQVYPGAGLTLSGILLFRDSSAGIGGSAAPPAASGVYYMYLKYKDTPSDYTAKIVGFLYDPSSVNQVQTKNEVNVTTNFDLAYTTSLADAQASGILIASGNHSYSPSPTWNWVSDARTPLRIKSDLLPYEVVRKYGEFSNVGSFKTTKLGIQSQDEAYILWINNSGIDASFEMSASGLKYAYDNRHTPGSETTFTESGLTAGGHLILTDYNAISKGTGYNSTTDTPKASQEFTRLFRHLIVNTDGRTDGVNDRRIQTTLIPSKPGTPVNLSGFLMEMSTDSQFSTELNAALLNYNIKDLSVTQKNEGISLIMAFYGEVQRIATEQGYTKMSGLYDYSGIVYLGTQTYSTPTYTYTLNSAASGIVNGGYGITASGLGWTLDRTDDYYNVATTNNFVYRINTTSQSMSNEIISLERDRLQAATSVLSKTNRLELAPTHTRKQYKCRVTWSPVAEVNDEGIKYYNIRIYKLNPLTQANVPSNYTNTQLEGDYNKIFDLKDESTYARKKTYQSVHTSENITWTGLLTEAGYETTVIYPTSSAAWGDAKVGDYVYQNNGSDAGSPYFITKIINTSGLQLDRKFVYPISSYSKFSYFRTALESSTGNTRFDFDIYADQHYMVYVRAVSEYDVAGDWSDPLRVTTNSLTNSQSNTLANIVNADEMQIARTNEIRSVVFTQKLNTQINALQRAVDDTPSRITTDNLTVRISQLEPSA
ncbi:MAG: hypothetical protein ACP5N7_05480 [Candidatus Pacearchaeota archaeon]